MVLATYRPEDVRDEVDIAVRVPASWRELDQLERQTLNSPRGQVPLSQFVELEPDTKTGTIVRVDGQRTVTIKSDVAPGQQVDQLLRRLKERMPDTPSGLTVRFAGENEEQQEAGNFLATAFLVAIALMLLILVTQFNSLYQTFLILSAIVLSTAGVLLGLLLNGQSFGIVMVGMGIIALAGIVVNNNIILIDTYNQMRASGMKSYDAALETGCLRMRPVLLTAVTTVLGLMPMVLGINVDLLTPSLGLNAPSTQWWMQLSSAIAGGLTFATFLTLLLTPALLVIGERTGQRIKALTGRN
jgi:multidrug efflux pump